MADPKLCSIPDCGKLAGRHGWCRAHRDRWKLYGDPLAGLTGRGEARRYFEQRVLTYSGDDCLTWPFCRDRDGYGLLKECRKMKTVSRILCEQEFGPPPTPRHEAAHSCGKGRDGCVTRRHLSWKTSVENHADKLVHNTRPMGETHGAAKLTNQAAREIISLKGALSRSKIAKQYGISPVTVGDIHRGKSWKCVR